MGYSEVVTPGGANPAARLSLASSGTQLEVALLSDVGQVRPINEDSGVAVPLPEGGLFVVADGMGGHNAGDVASQMAVRLLQENYLARKEPTPERLLRALEEANRQLYTEANRPDRRGMGTTVTLLAIDAAHALIANVGDSRVYLLRGGSLSQLTRDHSWVAEQQRRGLLSDEEARNHRWKSVISNALGSSPELKLDFSGVRLEAGDLFLLCSDGLSGSLEDQQLAPFLAADLPLERKVRNLIDAANAAGGLDNITALLVQVTAVSEQPAAYPLPELEGDGPVLARTLLGTHGASEPLLPQVPSNVPYLIALYLCLLGLLLAPDGWRLGLLAVAVGLVAYLAYLAYRQRQAARARPFPSEEVQETEPLEGTGRA